MPGSRVIVGAGCLALEPLRQTCAGQLLRFNQPLGGCGPIGIDFAGPRSHPKASDRSRAPQRPRCRDQGRRGECSPSGDIGIPQGQSLSKAIGRCPQPSARLDRADAECDDTVAVFVFPILGVRYDDGPAYSPRLCRDLFTAR